MYKIFATLLILMPTTVSAQTITMDEKVTIQAGRLASIVIKTDGDDTSWTVIPPTNVDVFREYDPNLNLIKLRLINYSNGTCFIVVSTTLNKKVAQKVCVITVGDPTPPPPPPPPPSPDTVLLFNLKAAYAADTDTDKANQLEALTSLYDEGATFTKTKADLKTYNQLWQAFQTVAESLGCNGKLKGVQQLIANEMVAAGIPTSPADGNTAIDKTKVIAQLQRITSILKQVK